MEPHEIAVEKACVVPSWSKVDGKDLQAESLILNPMEELWIRAVRCLLSSQDPLPRFLKPSCDNYQSNSYIFDTSSWRWICFEISGEF